MKKKLILYIIFTFLIFFSKEGVGIEKMEKYTFDQIYTLLQKPMGPLKRHKVKFNVMHYLPPGQKPFTQPFDGSIPYQKINPERLLGRYEYFLYHVAKTNKELHPGDFYSKTKEYRFENNPTEIKLIRIINKQDNKIGILCFYFDNTDGVVDEERTSVYYSLEGEYGKAIGNKLSFKTRLGYYIFQSKDYYVMFGSYGKNDYFSAEIAKDIVFDEKILGHKSSTSIPTKNAEKNAK